MRPVLPHPVSLLPHSSCPVITALRILCRNFRCYPGRHTRLFSPLAFFHIAWFLLTILGNDSATSARHPAA